MKKLLLSILTLAAGFFATNATAANYPSTDELCGTYTGECSYEDWMSTNGNVTEKNYAVTITKVSDTEITIDNMLNNSWSFPATYNAETGAITFSTETVYNTYYNLYTGTFDADSWVLSDATNAVAQVGDNGVISFTNWFFGAYYSDVLYGYTYDGTVTLTPGEPAAVEYATSFLAGDYTATVLKGTDAYVYTDDEGSHAYDFSGETITIESLDDSTIRLKNFPKDGACKATVDIENKTITIEPQVALYGWLTIAGETATTPVVTTYEETDNAITINLDGWLGWYEYSGTWYQYMYNQEATLVKEKPGKPSIDELCGTYTGECSYEDWMSTNGNVTEKNYAVTITKVSDTEITIDNMLNNSWSFPATYDAATGAITFSTETVYNTYYNLYTGTFDANSWVLSDATNAVAQVGDDGVITFTNWFFGAYYGDVLYGYTYDGTVTLTPGEPAAVEYATSFLAGDYTATVLKGTDAYVYTSDEGSHAYDYSGETVTVEAIDDATIRFKNFPKDGACKATVDVENKTITIEPQVALYGWLTIAGETETTPVVTTYEQNGDMITINLDGWLGWYEYSGTWYQYMYNQEATLVKGEAAGSLPTIDELCTSYIGESSYEGTYDVSSAPIPYGENHHSGYNVTISKVSDTEIAIDNMLNMGKVYNATYDAETGTITFSKTKKIGASQYSLASGTYDNKKLTDVVDAVATVDSKGVITFNDWYFIYKYSTNYYAYSCNGTAVLTRGTAGIDEVISDSNVDENAPVEMFNLQGIRVNGDNLPAGIYIRRQGSKATKVLVK